MPYWIVATPNHDKQDAGKTRARLADNTVRKGLTQNYDFNIPNLKVGTLDSLVLLSEDMTKMDTQIEQITKKIARAYQDVVKSDPALDGAGGEKKSVEVDELRIGNKSPAQYIEKFEWDKLRYPHRAPLRSMVEKILQECQGTEEELRKNVAQYNEVRQNFTAIERRETGSLLVKPLAPFVKESDIIETEHLTTLIVVVPCNKEKEFVDTYELLEAAHAEAEAKKKAEREEQQRKLALAAEKAAAEAAKAGVKPPPAAAAPKEEAKEGEEGGEAKEGAEEKKAPEQLPPCGIVVPRSAKKLTPDDYVDEFCLFRIVVFKKGADFYKNLCRERRYTVRPFKFDAMEEANAKQAKAALVKKKEGLWKYIVLWCKTTYAEVFTKWVHIKAMRVFVEAVLRFGLPVDFAATLLELRPGNERKVHKVLGDLYASLGGQGVSGDDKEGGGGGQGMEHAGAQGEFYPYVFLSIDLSL